VLAWLFLLVPAATTLLVGVAHAQEWVFLDHTPEGTPADVQVVSGSDDQQTVIDVVIHGFWMEDVAAPNQHTYQRLTFPGLGIMNQTGAPLLPAVQMHLAVPTDAEAVTLDRVDVLDTRTFSNMQVYPQPIPERDHPEGDPEIFQIDEQLYASNGPWPTDFGPRGRPIEAADRWIPRGDFEAWPCKWDPATGELEVNDHLRLVLGHQGGLSPAEPGTIEEAHLAATLFDNWKVVQTWFPSNGLYYEGQYLFLYPQDLQTQLQPLIDQKKARGFSVTESTLESVGSTCSEIRDAIQKWYNTSSPRYDHYALLVGDDADIPLCSSPQTNNAGVVPTDDLYGSVNGDDLDEEVWVGRLSVDGSEDLANQVAKILNYENGRNFTWPYTTVGLVAHKQNAPNKYEGAQESVRTASYSVTPNFVTLYGSAGKRDSDVRTLIDDGAGIVCYRGHGSTSEWTGWNTSFDYFDLSDISALSNAPRTPVIWSIACNNSDLRVADCLAEQWMEKTDDGAVAHYGATVPSYTTPNHELDRGLFKAVFDDGITGHAQAICAAENQMVSAYDGDNAWMYLLLGDPEMKIKRVGALDWTVIMPEAIQVCPDGCGMTVEVFDPEGQAVQTALVSAWKRTNNGKLASGDEVFTNTYTDAQGAADLLVTPSTEGTIEVVVRDLDGNAYVGSVPVMTGTPAPALQSSRLLLRANPSVMAQRTVFQLNRRLDGGGQLRIFDARGRQLRSLRVGPGQDQISWNGCDDNGRSVSSGVYFVRLLTEGRQITTRVVKVR
jgi:hypothetical protein